MKALLRILCTAVLAAASSPFPQQSGDATATAKQGKSFLREIGPSTWVIGNDLWNVTQNAQYANKLMYRGKDRVGNAVGHYVSYNGAASDLTWTSAAIVASGATWVDVRFRAAEGDLHWVIQDDLPGAYQYFVNRNLPTLGEFRTLWRLSNTSFPNGHTNVKTGALPALQEYYNATKVQDETWQKSDGTFLTKYDWAAFLRDQTAHGVWGDEVGSWYIHAGKEYFNGDHLKQELMVHRESKTGDTVQLNMLHGTHYQAISRDAFATAATGDYNNTNDNNSNARIWGPWLWYLNNGSIHDASARWETETHKWPYKWLNNTAYQARGALRGTLRLSDSRPAAGAAVFLGDNRNDSVSTLDQGQNYYYTTYADETGSFYIPHIRTASYALYAWPNGGSGGPMADITTNFTLNDVVIQDGKTTSLPPHLLTWPVTDTTPTNTTTTTTTTKHPPRRIFQIGAWDRKTDGFHLADPTLPIQHARIDKCPANLTYTVGTSTPEKDWCFGQSKLGTWSVVFFLAPSSSTNNTTTSTTTTTTPGAKLLLSLAGFSQGSSATIFLNQVKIGTISSSAGLPNSQDTYRGATRAGEWRRLEFEVPRGLLREGQQQKNSLDVKVTTSTQWRGWLWDSLVLEQAV